MYRLYLLLFVFLLAHLFTNAQIELDLKAVSVDTTTTSQNITLTWQFDPNVTDVEVFACNSNCIDVQNNYNTVALVNMNMSLLEWSDIVTDPGASQIYYCIAGRDAAGHTNSGKTAPKNNMVLKVSSSVAICRNVLSLSWNPYIRYVNFSWFTGSVNIMDTLDYYIFYREKIIGTPWIFLDSVTNIDPATTIISYQTPYLKNNTDYEFVVQAVSRTDTMRPFSNIAECRTGFEIHTPVAVEITCVSVIDDNSIEINVQTDDFSGQPFQKLYLLRDKSNKEVWRTDSLSFKVIDSMNYNSTDEYLFKDENADTQSGLHYYRAVADNLCRTNDSSNVLTNIYLYGRRVEKYADSLRFSQVEIPFIQSYNYDLFRVVYDNEILITGGLTMTNNRSVHVDVMPFMNDGAAIKYLIKSDDGCSSVSNIWTIDHEPLIQFPNAFYPLSMNIENRTFYPILRFPSEDNYLFIIYNQWGQEVYRSTVPPVFGDYENPQGRWDGTFRGKDCPPGFYAYKISYSFNEGAEKYGDTGSVMLVR